MVRSLSALVLGAAVTIVPAQGLAHPILDEAQQRFGEADFEGALEAFERAERADDLTRADLIQLYISRALVHHTVGDAQKLELDLFRLATMEPEYEFGREVPPVVQDAFVRVKEDNSVARQLSVSVRATSAPGGIRVEAVVAGDLAAMVQTIRVALRTPGNAWTVRENSPLEAPVTSDQTVEYYAEAIGPGGAVVAFDGTPDEPQQKTVATLLDPSLERPGPRLVEPETPTTGGLPLWPFLVGGAVALVAGGVLAALYFTGGESDVTDLACCTVEVAQ